MWLKRHRVLKMIFMNYAHLKFPILSHGAITTGNTLDFLE